MEGGRTRDKGFDITKIKGVNWLVASEIKALENCLMMRTDSYDLLNLHVSTQYPN